MYSQYLTRSALKFSLLIAVLMLAGCSFLNTAFTDEELSKFVEYPVNTSSALYQKQLEVRYFGVSTLLISDGETKILIDGFFSRPGLSSLLFGMEPDKQLISDIINKYQLQDLSVVIPVHSHHDHVMDAPLIAKNTDAILLGTASTFKIGINLGMPEHKWQESEPGEAQSFGDFSVVLIPSQHGDMPDILHDFIGMGEEIKHPIEYPATVRDYAESSSYSVLVSHPDGTMLIHASPGFHKNALNKYQADWIFLGIPNIRKLSPEQQQSYFEETVEAVGARHIIPIHWDDFMRSAHVSALYPNKGRAGNFAKDLAVLERLITQEDDDGIDKDYNLYLMQKEQLIYID